jgi:hypothetical protein
MKKQDKETTLAQGAEVVNGSASTETREIGVNLPVVQKKAVDLATTIKGVEALHKKIQHRDRLEYYTEELQSFSVEPKEEDLESTNRYYGCKLEITDDHGNSFELKHPVVIKEVIDFMFGRFSARKAEIEAEIVFPTAA